MAALTTAGTVAAAGCLDDSPDESPVQNSSNEDSPPPATTDDFAALSIDTTGDLVIEIDQAVTREIATNADASALAIQIRRPVDEKILYTTSIPRPDADASGTRTETTPVARFEDYTENKYNNRSLTGELSVELIERDRDNPLSTITTEIIPDLTVSTDADIHHGDENEPPQVEATIELTNESPYPVHLTGLETTRSHDAFDIDSGLTNVYGLDAGDTIEPGETATASITARFGAHPDDHPDSCSGQDATSSATLVTTPGTENLTTTFSATLDGDTTETRRYRRYCDAPTLDYDLPTAPDPVSP